jgi:endonuclease YncB( thermonuclease family)
MQPIRRIVVSFALLILVAAASQAQSVTLRGKIVNVFDGDTISLVDGDNKEHQIRIEGVDAPEEGQVCYEDAKKRLSDLLLDKEVTVEIVGKEEPGREVGILKLDGRDVGLEMVESGLAWHNEYFDLKQSQDVKVAYAYAELRARGSKRGVWAETDPLSPWAYRRLKNPTLAKEEGQTPSATTSTDTSPTNSGGTVHVKGYYRKDGTYVRPHTRRAPRRKN